MNESYFLLGHARVVVIVSVVSSVMTFVTSPVSSAINFSTVESEIFLKKFRFTRKDFVRQEKEWTY